MRRFVLIVLLSVVSSCAWAYPASTSCVYAYASGTGTYSSLAGAQAAMMADYPGYTFYGWCAGPGTACSPVSAPSCSPDSYAYGLVFNGSYVNAGIVNANTSASSCPGGGTLSGSTCTCPSGYTDTGSACTAPACPSGQFRRADGDACEAKCPANQDNGPAESKSGVKTFCMVRQDFAMGTGYYDTPSTTGEVRCMYRHTGAMVVCSTYADNTTTCGGTSTRGTGTSCGSATDVPPDSTPTTCDTGDLYCRSSSCPAGYVGATFNGNSLCVKKGEPVSAVPAPDSNLAPPTDSDVESPPTGLSPPGDSGDEALDPDDRIVVGIGDATEVETGDGNGDGEIEVNTCGLPDTAPCLIDESGTPDGTGADTDAKAGVESSYTSLTDKLTEVVGGTGAPDRSWGFSISFPTTCNPIVITFPLKVITLDFCQWQPVIHDLMSLIWVSSTLFLCIGMVGRTVTAAA